MNVAAIMGRLTADPELRHTANGIAVTSFTLAVDRSYARQGEERQTDFIDFVAWRNTAEFICKYFAKGRQMAVTGSIQTRNYEDRNGNKRKAVEILVDQVNFADSKRESSGSSYGGSYESAGASQKPAAFNEPAPAYSSGSDADFQDVLDDDDLPF